VRTGPDRTSGEKALSNGDPPRGREGTGSPAKGYICVITAAVLWASSGSAGKGLFSGGITPFDLVQVRVTVSSVLLALIFGLFARHLFRIRVRDIGYFCLLGGVVMALVQGTYFFAISKIQVAAAIFIQYLSPVIVALYSSLFWRERLTPGKIGALVLSMAGCYLVVGGYNLELLHMNRIGLLAGLLSAFCFAAYSLISERGMHRYTPWTVLFYAMVFASLSWNLFYSPFKYLRAGYSPDQWVWMIYIGIFGTAMPFGLYLIGVNHIRSTRASITSTLEPISAAFIAYLFLGETLEPLQALGGALVVAAIVLLQLRRERDLLTPALVRAETSKEFFPDRA
jgi:drug/metabolite transporter (DMT)-like permease